MEPLEDELGKYEDKWVAILEPDKRIVASGDSAYDAKQKAEAEGYPEITLLKVPRFDRTHIFSA